MRRIIILLLVTLCLPVYGQCLIRPTNTIHLTSDQTPLNTLDVYVTAPVGKEVHVLWGDGNITTHTGNGSNTKLSHDYAGTGDYDVTVSGTYPMTDFRCYSEPVSGDIGDLSGLTNLSSLWLYSTSVSGDIGDLSGLTNLASLLLYSTSVSDTLSELAGNTDIDYLYVYSTNCDGWDDVTLSNNWAADDVCNIKAQDCGWDQASVDQILIDLAAMVTGSDDGSLNIGGTNAARSAASDAAKTTLLNNGWDITVNE